MDNRPTPIENQEQHNRNQNYRRPLPPPRIQWTHEDQQIRTPPLDNYVAEEGEEDLMENQNHHFDDIDSKIYLTEEEHNWFAQEDDSHISEIYSEQYQRGYQNAINNFQKKLKLRSHDGIINKGRPKPNQISSYQQSSEKIKIERY